jgi:hypothetical protein
VEPGAAQGIAIEFSEVLADPVEPGRDGTLEWVEIYNAGAEPVSLEGWTIADLVRSDSLGALVVPPGAYAIIAGSDAIIPEDVIVFRLADGTIGNGINNDGDQLVLTNPAGEPVATLAFGVQQVDGRVPAPGSGVTIGRLAPGDPGWALTSRPTPGQPNEFPIPEPAAESPTEGEPGTAATSEAGTDVEVSGAGGVTVGAAGASTGEGETPAADGGGTPWPWILLGGAGGAGAAGLAALGRRLAPRVRVGTRRGP